MTKKTGSEKRKVAEKEAKILKEVKQTRLHNIISVSTTKRLFEARLEKECRTKIRKAIKSMIVLLEVTLVDLRDAH